MENKKRNAITKYYIILTVCVVLLIMTVGIFLLVKNTAKQEYTAQEVVNKLKEKNVNIGKIVVYTEETDLNKQLGRPNQYTSKATFEDKRLEQRTYDEYADEEINNEPVGGTVEVFKTKEDMEKRKKYIEGISSSISMLNQYIYSKDCILFRLESDLTPSQAKEYENIFKEI